MFVRASWCRRLHVRIGLVEPKNSVRCGSQKEGGRSHAGDREQAVLPYLTPSMLTSIPYYGRDATGRGTAWTATLPLATPPNIIKVWGAKSKLQVRTLLWAGTFSQAPDVSCAERTTCTKPKVFFWLCILHIHAASCLAIRIKT